MFVHISPEPDAVGETISTLKFAERVSTVELGAARTNKDNGEVKELREQVSLLLYFGEFVSWIFSCTCEQWSFSPFIVQLFLPFAFCSMKMTLS